VGNLAGIDRGYGSRTLSMSTPVPESGVVEKTSIGGKRHTPTRGQRSGVLGSSHRGALSARIAIDMDKRRTPRTSVPHPKDLEQPGQLSCFFQGSSESDRLHSAHSTKYNEASGASFGSPSFKAVQAHRRGRTRNG